MKNVWWSKKYVIWGFLSFSLLLFCPAVWAFKVALVLDQGGKDDKSFNNAAYVGAMKAQKELGIELKYVEANSANALETLDRSFAKKDYDLIIGISFAQTDAVKKTAAEFPNKKF